MVIQIYSLSLSFCKDSQRHPVQEVEVEMWLIGVTTEECDSVSKGS